MDVTYREITKSALWTVSTVKGGYAISSMFNRSEEDFWQSDAIPPHWISAQFSEQTFLSRLSVFLAVNKDDTYTPVELVIYIGNDPTALAEFKTAEPSRLQGWVDIDLNVSTIFLKIAVTKNHQGGRDSRIRQIRLFGAPYSPCIDPRVYFFSPEVTQYLSIR
jgi:anaphase-promoting complex subunit 10